MDINVKEKTIGECHVKSYHNLDDETKYLLKALCGLQILTMNSKEDPEKHKEFIEILKETARKTDELFNVKKESVSATDFFD
ncbi:MAG: hypothetical protein M0R17_03130 [Candidatus Omnitrophica bacterium]|jgi:hypothetical protein|nr:hypothetical protein [Candidatus Omnitrophota bacterium]